MSSHPQHDPTHPLMFSAKEGRRLLKAHGSKLTSQRVAMLEVFELHCAHVTAQHMFERLTRREPTLSRATVYNNLDLFVQIGLIARHQSDEGVVYYDANTAPHHHVVCPGCGAVSDVDVPAELMDKLLANVSTGSAPITLQSASIWFKGVCQACVVA